MSQPSLPLIEPPHDLEAERNCLAAMAFRRDNVPMVVDTGLEPGHFYDPANGLAYGRIIERWIADEPLATLRGEDSTPQVSRPDLYAIAVLDAAARREAFCEAAGIDAPTHIGWKEYWEARNVRPL